MKKFIYITILALIFMDVQFQLALLIKRKALYLKMMNFLFKPILLKAIKFLKFKMRPCLYIFIQDQLFMCKKV